MKSQAVLSTSSNGKANNQAKDMKDWSHGTGVLPFRDYLGPLLLMITTPCVTMIFFHGCTVYRGNFVPLLELMYQKGIITTLQQLWPDSFDRTAWTCILSFMMYQLVLMRIIPGRTFVATSTPTGHQPRYCANGMACYIITVLTAVMLHVTHCFRLDIIYDKYGEILAALNIFAWIFCFLLFVKGHVAPSTTTTDAGSTGNYLQDFYWGMELYRT
jgi:7-dehydrocholesterol reductase